MNRSYADAIRDLHEDAKRAGHTLGEYTLGQDPCEDGETVMVTAERGPADQILARSYTPAKPPILTVVK